MTRQQVTRRLVLGAVAMTLALPGLGAAAEGYAEGPTSGAGFKGYCEDNGGIFTDTEDGNLWCQWDDDSQTLCDTNGEDCHDIAYTPPKPSGPALGGAPSTQGAGPGSPLLVTAPSVGAIGSVRAQDHEQDHNVSKPDKRGKHRQHGKQGRH